MSPFRERCTNCILRPCTQSASLGPVQVLCQHAAGALRSVHHCAWQIPLYKWLPRCAQCSCIITYLENRQLYACSLSIFSLLKLLEGSKFILHAQIKLCMLKSRQRCTEPQKLWHNRCNMLSNSQTPSGLAYYGRNCA